MPLRGPLPLRQLAEGCALAVGSVPVLALLRASWPLLVLGPVSALAGGVAWPLRVWDVPARRWAVVPARLATVWFLAFSLPALYFSVLARVPGFGVGGLFWVLFGLMASLAGTFLVRERHDLAGVVLKVIALGPLTLLVAATGSPGTLSLWEALVGWTALALLVALCAAAFSAWRRDPLDPGER